MDRPWDEALATTDTPAATEPSWPVGISPGDFYDADAVTFVGATQAEAAIVDVQATDAELRKQVRLRLGPGRAHGRTSLGI
jgi:hypothetical protein